MVAKGQAFAALRVRPKGQIALDFELLPKMREASAEVFFWGVFAGNGEDHSRSCFVLTLGFCGEPSGRAWEVSARIELFNLRLNSVECGSGGDAVEDDLMPDFIFSEAGGSGYAGSDGFLNN